MEIKIRNIDKDIVLRIDSLAKKKGMSREQYLRLQLELLSYSSALREQDEKYSALVKQICDFIEYQNNRLEKLVSSEH